MASSVPELPRVATDVLAEWTQMLGRMESRGLPIDVDALVQWVMRESFLETAGLHADVDHRQQTLQLMTSLSKMLHDTATAVLRKIGT
jgi:hypothetical protein